MSWGSTAAIVLLLLQACGGEPGTPPAAPGVDSMASPIPTVGGLQAQRTDVGLVADLLTATREGGTLTVTIRFRNAGSDTLTYALSDADGGVRLTAGGRDWPLAREPDTPEEDAGFEATMVPGESQLWRAVFEAPPRSVRTFDLEISGVEPFREVPVEDRSP